MNRRKNSKQKNKQNEKTTFVERNRKIIEECARSQDADMEDAQDALVSLGTLVLMGKKEEAARLVRDPRLSWLEQWSGELLGDELAKELDEAAVFLLQVLPALREEDGVPSRGLTDQVAVAISARDRVESLREGAKLFLEGDPPESLDLQVAVEAFDQTLAPMLWRTLPLGKLREAQNELFAPELRHRLWWWNRGADLPHDALLHLETAARVIHAFPEARAELERLIAAEEGIEGIATGESQTGRVVSLAEHFARQALARHESRHERLQLAASDECMEQVILEREDLVLSVRGTTLIVDLEQPPADEPDPVATIQVPEHSVLPGKPAEIDSFTFDLGDDRFAAGEGTLTVRLKDGAVTIPLPLNRS
jgi:hypothetical protein